MLKAKFIVFQIMEEHADDTHNFLLVEKVKNFRNMLDDVQLEICEAFHRKLIVRENPKSTAHVVGDCTVIQAVSCEDSLEDCESILWNKYLG